MEIFVLVLAALLIVAGIGLFVIDARRRSGTSRPDSPKKARQKGGKVPAAVAAGAPVEESAVAGEQAGPVPEEAVPDSTEEYPVAAENDHEPQLEVEGEGSDGIFSGTSDETEERDIPDTEHLDEALHADPEPVPGDGVDGDGNGNEVTEDLPPEDPEAAESREDSEDSLEDEIFDGGFDDIPGERADEDWATAWTESPAEGPMEAPAEGAPAEDMPAEPGDGRGGMPGEDLYEGLDDIDVSVDSPERDPEVVQGGPEQVDPGSVGHEPVEPEVPAGSPEEVGAADRPNHGTDVVGAAAVAGGVAPAAAKSRFGGLADKIRTRARTGGRRARRAWATGKQARFMKTDHEFSEELQREWTRGPKGPVQDIVSNIFVDGREFLLVDVGDSTVLALRSPLLSDVTLEFARSEELESPDLASVGVEDGFLVSSNQPEIIHRVFDDRAHYVLRMMPDTVERQWTEDGWVVAVLTPTAGPADWDDCLEPLADFSDIARRLPPATEPMDPVDMSTWDPSRPSAANTPVRSMENTSGRSPLLPRRNQQHPEEQQEPERKVGGHLSSVPNRDDRMVFTGAIPIVDEEDPIWRPEPETSFGEPVDLPSRLVGSKHGDLEFRDLGTSSAQGSDHSSLPALGEDPEHIRARRTAGRVVREDTGPSGIFDDGRPSEEWGAGGTDGGTVREETAADDNGGDPR